MDEILERIFSRCVEEEGPIEGSPCLVWTGAKRKVDDPEDYGVISFRGRQWLVHRLVYQLCVEPIPEGMQVNHICDQKDCCRPDHLKPGDDQSNADDRVARGRSAIGSGNGKARLFERDAVEILRLANEGKNYAAVARQFGVSDTVVSAIAKGITWKHLPGPRREPQQPTNRFLGVSKNNGKWWAYLSINGKRKHFGFFDSEIEAALRVNYEILTRGLDKPLNEFEPSDVAESGQQPSIVWGV